MLQQDILGHQCVGVKGSQFEEISPFVGGMLVYNRVHFSGDVKEGVRAPGRGSVLKELEVTLSLGRPRREKGGTPLVLESNPRT